MATILKCFLMVIFFVAWGVIGFFYWVLILGRLTFFIGAELLSSLFTQRGTPNLSPLVERASMIYLDGFKSIYIAFFGSYQESSSREPITIKSFYELLATLFVAYLMFALVFPATLLPDVTGMFEDFATSASSQEGNGWFSLGSAFIGIVVFIPSICLIAFLIPDNKLSDEKLVKEMLKLGILKADHVRTLSDKLGVSFPELQKHIVERRGGS